MLTNMADAKFDKDGKIENIAELTVEEVDAAHQAQRAKVFDRAKTAEQLADERKAALEKSEADLKAEREKNAKPKDEKPSVDADELRILVRLSDEEADEAKAIAKGRGITLAEAIKTKSFQLFQADLKETERKEKAKLGAGKGSGEGGEDDGDDSEDKPITKRDMTREEHQKAFKKRLGK